MATKILWQRVIGSQRNEFVERVFNEEKAVPVILLTHPCKESALNRAVAAIDALRGFAVVAEERNYVRPGRLLTHCLGHWLRA